MEKVDWVSIWYKCLSCHKYFQNPEQLLVHRTNTECANRYPEILGQLEQERNEQSNANEDAARKNDQYLADLNDFETALLNGNDLSIDTAKEEFAENLQSEANIPLQMDETCSSDSKVRTWMMNNDVSRVPFKRSIKRKRGLKFTTKRFQCLLCSKYFGQKGNLKVHLALHKTRKSYKCPDCDLCFFVKKHFNTHVAKVHNKQIIKQKVTLSLSQKVTHKCSKCEKVFPFACLLKNHLLLPCSKTYQCKTCEKTFRHPNNLKMHLKTHETEVKTCKDCGKKFRFLSLLKSHTEENQNGINCAIWHPCDKCVQKFKTIRELQNHARVHNEFHSYKCAICETSFNCYKVLRNHIMETHTNLEDLLNIQPYKCNFCKMCFKEVAKLNTHLALHEPKAFKCKFCNYSACLMAYINAHVARMHKNQ